MVKSGAHAHRTFVLAMFLALGVASCGGGRPPERTAEECAKISAKTAVAAAKTGATTAVEGVKTVGRTVAGFFDGGTEQAREEWREGAAETRSRARSGGEEVKREAKTPGCP